jgi:FHS family Na+ dependent glucose MFS transporter 1
MKLSETTLPPKPALVSDIRFPRIRITISYYIAFIGLGLTVASLGPTLPALAEHTRAQLREISFLFTARALGYMFGSLLGGQLYDRMPGNPVMGGMLIMLALGLVLVPIIPLLWLLAVILLAIGVVEGVIDVGGNTLLVWLHRDKVGPFMNALHFFFGLGAFLSPIIIAQALRTSGDITWGYWALAVLVFPVSMWLFNLPSPKAQDISQDNPVKPANLLLVSLLAFFFFLFVAAEVSYGGWIATYALVKGLATETVAAYMASAFWGALTLGRLLSIPIALRFKPKTILVSDLLGCLLSVVILLIWPNSLAVTWLGTFGIGFSLASLFPTTISMAERSITVTGRTTAWFLVGGSLGAMFVPWLIGQLFEAMGPQAVMWTILLDLVVALSIFFVLLARLRRVELQKIG